MFLVDVLASQPRDTVSSDTAIYLFLCQIHIVAWPRVHIWYTTKVHPASDLYRARACRTAGSTTNLRQPALAGLIGFPMPRACLETVCLEDLPRCA